MRERASSLLFTKGKQKLPPKRVLRILQKLLFIFLCMLKIDLVVTQRKNIQDIWDVRSLKLSRCTPATQSASFLYQKLRNQDFLTFGINIMLCQNAFPSLVAHWSRSSSPVLAVFRVLPFDGTLIQGRIASVTAWTRPRKDGKLCRPFVEKKRSQKRSNLGRAGKRTNHSPSILY